MPAPAVYDANVLYPNLVTDFEQHIDSLELPDPNDRHVAIHSHAELIVTWNLRGAFLLE